MSLHWTDKRRACANLAHALKELGWELYGYHADNSDFHSDYHDPASWSGVATHTDYPGVVVVSGQAGYYASQQSGADIVETEYLPGNPCTCCGGSGDDPSGWTYTSAKAEPERFNRDWTAMTSPSTIPLLPRVVSPAGAIPLLPRVVSPAPFKNGTGALKCRSCNGHGHELVERKTVVGRWPEFSPPPKGKAWAVEYNGRRCASGTGFAKMADYRAGGQNARAVAEQITAIAKATVHGPAPANGNGATARSNGDLGKMLETAGGRVERERDWLWIKFPDRPSDEVLAAMSAGGGRFSKKRRAWYFTDGGAALGLS